MRGLTLRSTGRCAIKPRSAGDLHVHRRYAPMNGRELSQHRVLGASRRRTLVGADTAHCVHGLRPLGVARPAFPPTHGCRSTRAR